MRDPELLLIDPPPRKRRRTPGIRRCRGCGAWQLQGVCQDCVAKDAVRPPGLWYCSACRGWTAGGRTTCNRCHQRREGEGEAVFAAATGIPDELVRPVSPTEEPTYQVTGFAFDSDAVPPSQLPAIASLAGVIAGSWRTTAPVEAVELIGHTDSSGPAAYNADLGRRRAAAVGRQLLAETVRRDPMGAAGLAVRVSSAGATRPVADNATADGRATNRRVTVTPRRRPRPTPPSPSAPRPVRVAVQVTNRLLPGDPVGSAAVVVNGPGGRATGRTTATGGLRLNVTGLADGTYTLTVTGPSTLPDATLAGPTTATGASPPDRIWRVFRGTLTLRAGRATAATGTAGGEAGVAAGTLRVRVQPVWMASPNRGAVRAAGAADLLVLHHTGGTTARSALAEFMRPRSTSAHYLVDTDGQVVKLVAETRPSHHAGLSHWAGRDGVNDFSVGVEIVHAGTGPYPAAQQRGVLALVGRIRAGVPSIPAGRVVGHSDIATNCQGRGCTGRVRQLGRKSTDPGVSFPWGSVEAAGLGLRRRHTRPLAATAYRGFFAAVPGGRLRPGDRDRAPNPRGPAPVYGGVRRPTLPAGAVRELQTDLAAIGYFCPATGVYDVPTERAVQMFQEHFAGRLTARPPGQVNAATATLVKQVRP